MKSKIMNIKWYVLLALILFFNENVMSQEYCNDAFCITLPDNTKIINSNNWKKHKTNLPENIISDYVNGSSKEVWMLYDNCIVVEQIRKRINLAPEKVCNLYKNKLYEKLLVCSPINPIHEEKGLQVISYYGPFLESSLKYIYTLNGTSIAIATSDIFPSESAILSLSYKLLEIIRTVKKIH